MHPLKVEYYQSHYLATIRILENGSFQVEGGMGDKRLLKKAKQETHFCYVKNMSDGSELRLVLIDGEWCLPSTNNLNEVSTIR